MIRKLFSKILFSQIIIAFAVTICTFIDGSIIGKFLGTEAMAAFGLSLSLVTLFAALGGTVASGIQAVIGHAVGSGQQDELNCAYRTAMIISGLISILCMVGVIVFVNPIVLFLGAPSGSKIALFTKQYLIGYIIGCPAFIGTQVINPFLQVLGKRKIVVLSILIMSVADIIGDLLNVFLFHGGTFGMGLASSISYYFAAIMLLAYMLKVRDKINFLTGKFKLTIFKLLIISGSTYAVYQICRVIFSIYSNKIVINAGGDYLLAAYSIAKNIYTLCISAGMGIAATTLLLTGIVWGEKNRTSLEQIVKAFLHYSILINAILIIFIEIFAPGICNIFLKDNADVLQTAVKCLRIYCIAILFFSINSSIRSFYQGIRKIMLAQVICVLQICVLPLLLANLLKLTFPDWNEGIWWAFVLGEAVTFIIVLIYSVFKNKKVMKISEALILCPGGKNNYEPLIFNIKTQDDVILSSQTIFNSYQKYFPNGKNGMKLALCVEEIGMNYLKYGRQNDKTEMEIRFLCFDHRLRLEYRDNGISFNPCEYFETNNTEKTDLENNSFHIGLKLVFSIAKDIKYTNVIGLNSLIIEMEEA